MDTDSNSTRSGSTDVTADLLKKMAELSAQVQQANAENAKLRKEVQDEKFRSRNSCPEPVHATPAHGRATPAPLFTPAPATPAKTNPSAATPVPMFVPAPATPATPYPFYYAPPVGHHAPPVPSPFPFPHHEPGGASPYYPPPPYYVPQGHQPTPPG